MEEEVLLAQPGVPVVLVRVHRAAEDEYGAVGIERLRQGRFPGEAPLVEAVPAFPDDVPENARTDALAVDDRQYVHQGHSTLKRPRPPETARPGVLTPLGWWRDPDHATDRIADDRRGAGDQWDRAGNRCRRPLDEEVGHFLRQPAIEDVLPLACLRRGDRFEIDAALASDTREQLHSDAARRAAGDVHRPGEPEEAGPRLPDALDRNVVRHRHDPLRLAGAGRVRRARARRVRGEQGAPELVAGARRVREDALDGEGRVQELRPVRRPPGIARREVRIPEADG